MRQNKIELPQSKLEEQTRLNEALIEHLAKIKALFSRQLPPSCCIVHAPPKRERKAEEFWVEPFVSQLYEHLMLAGIRPVMEMKDLRPGESWYRFMEQYKRNPIILIGTESLNDWTKEQQSCPKENVLMMIEDRIKTEKHLIHPFFISGNIKTAFSREFALDSTIINGDNGYVAALKHLIDKLLKQQIQHKKEEYDLLWADFAKTQPASTKYSVRTDEQPVLRSEVKRYGIFRPSTQGKEHPSIDKGDSARVEWLTNYVNNSTYLGLYSSKNSSKSQVEATLKVVAEATFWSVTLGLDVYFAKMSYAQIWEFQALYWRFEEETEKARLINDVWAKLAQLAIPDEKINAAIGQAAWCVYVHHNSVEKMHEEENEYESNIRSQSARRL